MQISASRVAGGDVTIDFEYRSSIRVGVIRTLRPPRRGAQPRQIGLLRYAIRPGNVIRLVTLEVADSHDFMTEAHLLIGEFRNRYPALVRLEVLADAERVIALVGAAYATARVAVVEV